MDEIETKFLEKMADLKAAMRKVGESDKSIDEKKTDIRKLNLEIKRIKIAMADVAAAEITAAARELSEKTLAATDNVLKNILDGLVTEVEQLADMAIEISREMTDDPVEAAPVLAAKPLLIAPVSDDPVLLRQTRGSRQVFGHLVREMQVGLQRLGFAPQGIDMIFGPDSAESLLTWRAATGRNADDAILTKADWTALTGKPAPQLFDICAQATAAFEGHGFDQIIGDFDGAVLTWGYHGYTLKFGHLQAVLKTILADSPGTFETVFGAARATELADMLALPLAAQLDWARQNVLDNNKKVQPDWHKKFAELGGLEVTQNAQLSRSRDAFWQRLALPHAALMGLSEPLSLGMLFDAAIQQGGASRATISKVNAERAGNPNITEMQLRKVLADALTSQIKSDRFRADVAARRKIFITGRGQVHGATYDLGFWGFFAEHDENESSMTDAIMPLNFAAAVPVSAGFEAFFATNIKPIAPNFSAAEFLVKGGDNSIGKCKGLNTDPPQDKWDNCIELARVLQAIRTKSGAEVRINSCYRSPAYNGCIGGAAGSKHKLFQAADITIKNGKSALSWHRLVLDLRNEGLFKGGIGRYKTFVHVDVRGENADWVG